VTTDWSGYENFATRNGAGIVEVIRMSPYDDYEAFINAPPAHREFWTHAIGEWHTDRQPSGMGGL